MTLSNNNRPVTPIWAAIHTPFLPSLELDEAGLRHNVRHYRALGLAGVFCNGLMGEVWALSPAERKRVVEVLADAAEGILGISVVISSASIDETLELGRHAKAAGARHAVLMVPTTGPRSDEQLFAYFQHICAELDMPVVVFNSATAAGSPLNPALFERLCGLPQIELLKSTAYPQNPALRRAARNGVVVSDPLEEHFLSNRSEHGQSILYADPEPYLYQTAARRPVAEYIEHLDKDEYAIAEKKARELAPFRTIFNKWIMSPLMQGHMPNAALKHWCELVGLAGGPCRAPIQPLTTAERLELEADLARCAPLVRDAI